jgi:pilus assembly protein Flp/PilA
MLFQLISFMNVYLFGIDREEGQGMAEYALIIALIAIVVAIALPGVGTALVNAFEQITSNLGG